MEESLRAILEEQRQWLQQQNRINFEFQVSKSSANIGTRLDLGASNMLHFNPKVEFPIFDGTDPRGWVRKCAQYFSLCRIKGQQKVDLAALHLKGPAKVWFNSYILGRSNVMWEEFVIDVCERFRDNRGSFNPSGTLEAYSPRAEEIKAHSLVRKPILPDFYYGESLFGGLKPAIQSFEWCDGIYSHGHKCSDYLTVLGEDEEDLRQPDFGVENPPSMDAPQVLDESPKSNPDISSDGWVGEGQGKSLVRSQKLDGLNPSNDLLGNSLLSISDKSTFDAQGKQHGKGQAFPDENSGLYVLEEIGEEDDSEMCSVVEVLMLVGNSKALGLSSLFKEQAAAMPEKRNINMLACWIPTNPKRKEANGFCSLVFDPGILGAGQRLPQPKPLVPTYDWLAEIRVVFTLEMAVDDRTIGHNPEGSSLLKGGIVYSNAVVTVSQAYLKETLKSCCLSKIKHHDKYTSICNGLNTALWNPAADVFLPAMFTAQKLDGKAICKQYVQRGLRFPAEPVEAGGNRKPLVVCITRLVAQKSLHLIHHAIKRVEEPGGQMVVLGKAATNRIEKEFEGLAALHNQGSCIIISPTRELASQPFDVLKAVGKYHGLSAGLLIGGRQGVEIEKERVNELNILVCTPGRLLQHMDEAPNFECSQLQLLVLDGADRILDAGFKKALNAILSQLPRKGQTLLFSAAQTRSVQQLARLSWKDPEYLSVHEAAITATPNRLQQTATIVPLHQKLDLLWSFTKAHLNTRILRHLICLKNDTLPFIHGSTGTRVHVEALKRKTVLLLVSDLEIFLQELMVLNRIYNESGARSEFPFETVWLPIVDKSAPWTKADLEKFKELQSMMPWYTLHPPKLLEPAIVRYIKEVWKFTKKMIPVVVDDIDPQIHEWVKKGKHIGLYGGDSVEWIRRFTAKEVAVAAEMELELVHVGKGKETKERLKKERENLSHYWPDLTLTWYSWTRLDYMLYSKMQYGKKVEDDYIMSEVMTVLSYDGSEQVWPTIWFGLTEMAGAAIVHQHLRISAFATPHQSPPLALQPWVVFDPGGMIFLLTWLLLDTIHNLEAPSAVFDPGGDLVSRYIGLSPSESGAGTVMEALECLLLRQWPLSRLRTSFSRGVD